jgi:hypothetical protein
MLLSEVIRKRLKAKKSKLAPLEHQPDGHT